MCFVLDRHILSPTAIMINFVVVFCLVASALGSPVKLNGHPEANTRIIGGTDTTVTEHPYMVSILQLGFHACGGAMISSRWVLTLGTCAPYSIGYYRIRAGSTNLNTGGKVYTVGRLVRHPEWIDPFWYQYQVDYDFALLQIYEEFDIGTLQQPIPLPSQDEATAAGTLAVVTGWGQLWVNGPSTSDTLKEVTVPIIDQKECSLVYENFTDRMICAGVPGGGYDACKHDYGGPLVANNEVIGLVAWGAGLRCGLADYPGVYSRVASVSDWIKSTISA